MKKNYILILFCLILCIRTIKAQCPITITPNTANICAGGTITLTASGATTYTWNTGFTGNSFVVSPGSTTVYTVTASTGTCTSSAMVTVYVSPNPTITLSNSSSNICAGGTDTLVVTGAVTYTWAPGASLSNTTGATVVANPLGGTTYTVTGSSISGCISTQTVQVAVFPPLTLSITSTNPSCSGGCNGSAYVTSSGAPIATYIWDNFVTTASYSNICAGTHSVVVTDIYGCVANASTILSSPPPITVSVTATNASCGTTCDGSATLTVTGGSPVYTYNWSPVGTTTPGIANLCSGTYFVTVVDANACIATASTTISAPATPTVGFVMQKDTVNAGVWYAYPAYSANISNAIWYWGDGTSTSGLSPSHTYTTAAHYNICVSAFSTCGDSAQSCQNDSIYRTSNANSMITVDVINATTGIVQVSDNKYQVTMYPNPSNGSFTVETNSSTNQKLQIVDINGRIVLTQTINGKTTVDASNLNDGVYNISITGNARIINKRLVIVK